MNDLEFEIMMQGNTGQSTGADVADLAKLALSSGTLGAALGAGSKAVSGANSFKSLLRPAAKGAATGAGIALTAGMLGKLLKNKNSNDPNANAKQVAAGGAALGAGAGGITGYLLSKNYGKNVSNLDNLAFKKLKDLTSINFGNSKKSFLRAGAKKAGGLKSAAIGAGLGGLAGLFYGADEGSALDIVDNAKKRRKALRGEYE